MERFRRVDGKKDNGEIVGKDRGYYQNEKLLIEKNKNIKFKEEVICFFSF